MKRLSISSYIALCIALVASLALAACGGKGASATALPTFTPIPTYKYEEPTSAAQLATDVATAEATAATTTNTTLDAAAVEKGKGRYDALDCASCHGAAGEGTDKGSSLIVSKQTEDEFITFMRSGGKLGADHQYATNRLSDSGGKALYQYLLSLRKSS